MRLLSLVALVATLMWSCEAGINSDKIAISKIDSNIDFLELTADNQKDQTKRSLRRYDDNSMGEERGTGKLDDAAEKIIHVTQKRKFPKELITAVEKNLDDLVAAAAKATVAQKYSSKLSSRTLQQLEKIEILRSKDIASYSKKTGDGMRRKMTIGKDTKVAPILSSHVGRGNQHYEGKRRLLTCSVVSRRAEDGGGDVLLISSSNPNKNEFILPKGGWDHGETVGKSAWREVIEEGGVNGKSVARLGRYNFEKDEKTYGFQGFRMKAKTVYDQWAESSRYRLWVSYDDARELLQGRSEMLEMLRRAELADDFLKAKMLKVADDAAAALP